MKLVPKQYDRFNPVVLCVGLGWFAMGVYAVFLLGFKGPSILWLLRSIPLVLAVAGAVLAARQYTLWRQKQSDPNEAPGTSDVSPAHRQLRAPTGH